MRKLQTCEDIKKELRANIHRETLNRLNGHAAIFNQMTEKTKISMHLAKVGASSGTKDDLNEGKYATGSPLVWVLGAQFLKVWMLATTPFDKFQYNYGWHSEKMKRF